MLHVSIISAMIAVLLPCFKIERLAHAVLIPPPFGKMAPYILLVRRIHRTLNLIRPVYCVRRLCERPSIWFLSHRV